MAPGFSPKVDFVVIGSGIAGLRAAIDLGVAGTVLLLTKGHFSDSITHQARGGIVVGLDDDEEVALHLHETLRSGDGLCREEAVRILVNEGPLAIRELSGWGVRFDWKGAAAAPPGHVARKRTQVLRGPGDTLGVEILRVLSDKARSASGLQKKSHAVATGLLLDGPRAGGVEYLDEEGGAVRQVRASSVLLATGGLGQVYSETTNPPGASGSGVALAFRAGALLCDMEFIQFHPTVLHVQKAPRLALPESLRQKGAHLRNIELERFMHRYHEAGEMAPPDVVARAITIEMQKRRSEFVYADLTGLDPEHVKKHFPRVYSACLENNIDITSNLVPVRPAAHFAVGGVATDLSGATSLPGLYAAGEAASTGLHGANRLANNSLLEGLVFGKRAAAAMIARTGRATFPSHAGPSTPPPRAAAAASALSSSPASKPDIEGLAHEIRVLMWKCVGVIRDGKKLAEAANRLNEMALPFSARANPRHHEVQSILEVARVITCCAAARQESRGVHYRADFPLRRDSGTAQHSFISKHSPVFFD